MAFDCSAGGHAFDGPGGSCLKCGMKTKDYLDTDSKQYLHRCSGQKPEQPERMFIDEGD